MRLPSLYEKGARLTSIAHLPPLGIFLVAINPYHSLDIYSPAHIEKYRNRRREENPPHIFAIAERAWVNMREGRESQSVLIT